MFWCIIWSGQIQEEVNCGSWYLWGIEYLSWRRESFCGNIHILLPVEYPIMEFQVRGPPIWDKINIGFILSLDGPIHGFQIVQALYARVAWIIIYPNWQALFFPSILFSITKINLIYFLGRAARRKREIEARLSQTIQEIVVNCRHSLLQSHPSQITVIWKFHHFHTLLQFSPSPITDLWQLHHCH